ncbi:hypothetical protein ACFLX4_00525 [Chloroflexota bacterium]
MNEEAQVKRVSSVIGDGSIHFYPELPQRPLKDYLGKDVMVMDAQVLRDWEGDFGRSDWCLLQLQDMESGENFTTKCGGKVLTKRVSELIARKALPIVGAIVTQGDTDRPYYNIV